MNDQAASPRPEAAGPSHPAWRLVEADLRDVALEVVDFGNNQTVSMLDMIQRSRWSSWVCTSSV